MPGYSDPELSTAVGDFRLSKILFKTQVVIDVKPSDTASYRLASYQTRSWMLSTLSSWFPIGKFLTLMWGSTKIFWDSSPFLSLIHGNFCCNGLILYACVTDPWKLLLWPHSLCLCRWSMEPSAPVFTFFMYVSLIHGNFRCHGHILYVCVDYPWKLPL
jgi:hypothetical protein